MDWLIDEMMNKWKAQLTDWFKLVPKVPCSFFGVINNEIKLLIERM